MQDSEKTSEQFYRALGAKGLAARTCSDWDAQAVGSVRELLPPTGKILDVGCGYGRIAIPLAGNGYTVTGIDLSPELIDSAKKAAQTKGATVSFDVGSMTDLPYTSDSFYGVICLWSAFNELLDASEQVKAMGEMYRVLKKNGTCIVELSLYTEPMGDKIESGFRYGPDYRIQRDVIEGYPNPHFMHDERSLRAVCEQAGIKNFNVSTMDWAGRPRQVLLVSKA